MNGTHKFGNKERKLVVSTTINTSFIWGNGIRQDCKGRFLCLLDHVEWKICHCTMCWECKDGMKACIWEMQIKLDLM